MDLAQRLKELRLIKNLSQRELGEKVGIANSTVSMYERGERTPDYDTLGKLADFFNVDIAYLLGKEKGSTYYLDPEAAEMAKEIFQRDEMRVLFDACRDVKKEDLEFVIKMLKGLRDDEE